MTFAQKGMLCEKVYGMNKTWLSCFGFQCFFAGQQRVSCEDRNDSLIERKIIMARFSSPIIGTSVQGRITINVMTVMDVNTILAQHNNSVSKDPNNPTPIGHSYIWMVSDDPRGWSTNGDPANISLKANVGDSLSFFCSGMNDNSETAAFIYQIAGGSPVINPSSVNVITLSHAAQPTAPTGYPFASGPVSFSSCDAKISKAGTAQNFWMRAALFVLADDGETQKLAGYVAWDPTVVVG